MACGLTGGTSYIVGCTFRDGGSSGGTSRSDLLVLSVGLKLPFKSRDKNLFVSFDQWIETIWVTRKTATGFTLNSSKPISSASVDWVLLR